MSIFKDKVAIVTGGASGIGRAFCVELARRGAVVVATDINQSGARETASLIGPTARGLALDVTKADDVARIVEQTASEHGRLDYLFNNAGIAVTGEIRDTPLSDWQAIISINLMGVVHGLHAAMPLMVRQGFGHIVNTASVAGLLPSPLLAAYSASKYAVVGLSAAARAEGADLGVKVSVVCPGVVKTPIIDSQAYRNMDKEKLIGQISMMTSPEKCARVVMKGVEKNRAVILVGLDGPIVYGSRFFPGFQERMARLIIKRARRLARVKP